MPRRDGDSGGPGALVARQPADDPTRLLEALRVELRIVAPLLFARLVAGQEGGQPFLQVHRDGREKLITAGDGCYQIAGSGVVFEGTVRAVAHAVAQTMGAPVSGRPS